MANFGAIGSLFIEIKAKGVKNAEDGIAKVESTFNRTAKSIISKAPNIESFMKRWGTSLALVGGAAGALYALIRVGPVAYSYFEEFGAMIGEVSDIIMIALSPILDPLINLLWGLVDVFGALPAPIQGAIGIIALLASSIVTLLSSAAVVDTIFGTEFAAKLVSVLQGIGSSVASSLLVGVAAGIGVGLTAVWILDKLGILNALDQAGRDLEKQVPTIFNLLKILTYPLGGLGVVVIDIVRGQFDRIIPDLQRIFKDAMFAVFNIAPGFFQWVSNAGQGFRDWMGYGNTKAITGYATGTDYVPRTGPYLLHQGEKVIPASNNSSSSNIYNTFNISGTNARDIADEVMRIISVQNRRLA